MKNIPEKWTGDIVREMHLNAISQKEIAHELGWTTAYVSMVLKGRRSPSNAQHDFESAVSRIKERRIHGIA